MAIMYDKETPPGFKSFDELSDLVQANGGVLTVDMGSLRDALKVRRLGVHVRQQISRSLRGAGLGHFPEDLPQYQEEPVRVYRMGSAVADLIQAVQHASPENDETLRQAAGGDAEAVLQQIRALVCE